MAQTSYIAVMLIGLRPGAVAKFRGDMSQRELARQAGVSRATVNRIEGGQTESVTFGTVNKIAQALGVDADMLVTFERPPQTGTRRGK
jgi:transcriptional regulator with XRE-family HTH domain